MVVDDKFILGNVVFEMLIIYSSVPNGDTLNIWMYESVTQKSSLDWRHDFETMSYRWCFTGVDEITLAEN